MQNNITEILERFKLPIALSFLGLVLIIGGIFASNINKKDPSASSGRSFPKESLVNSVKLISVDVSGAVLNPGVYKLNDGSRIEDAIKLAGGFAKNVNSEFVSKTLNMAQKLADGSKIYVSFEGESVGSAQIGSVAGVNTQSKVNINSSSQSEIEGLPSVGPVTASKIISSRPYQQIEDLLNKKAVSKAVFEKIKDLVVLY